MTVISPVHFPHYPIWPRLPRGDFFFDQSFFFHRGSWALAFGIMAIAKRRGKKSARVLFPDYFCREPLEIIKQFPIEVVYYPIQKSFEPDWESAARLCAQGKPPDALVLVHYFGFPNNLQTAKKFCDAYGSELIEDCAHIFYPFQEVGITGSLSIFSPWKFLALPLLGLLHARDDIQRFVDTPRPRRETFIPTIQWFAKREAQRVLCAMGVNWYRSTPVSRQIQKCGDVLSVHASSGAFVRYLFRAAAHTMDYIRRRRLENYGALDSFFRREYPGMLFEILSDAATPYVFPVITKDPAQKYVDELVCRGIPATRWPALPVEVEQNRDHFPWAHFYAEHLLLLPIHQNVSGKQVEYMKEQIKAVIR